MVLMYDGGTAVLEGTWSQIGSIPRSYRDLQVFGSKGTILMDDKNQVKIHTEQKPGGEIVDLPETSQGERNAVEYFLTCVKEDKPIEGLCSPGHSRDTQEILEAGIISSKTKTSVSIPIR
jgi:predicted dehydrogenase